MHKKFNVVIIGAGKIGAFFDLPKTNQILTHAHAFAKHNGFNLVGFVDTDLEKAKQASQIWGGNYFENIDQAFDQGKIDIVSVCTPDKFHYKMLKKLLEMPTKLIFAEKPMTVSVEEAEEVIALSKRKKIDIQVNYSRRFVPELINLQGRLKSMEYGKLISGTGLYGKGVVHNGSHMVDLIHTLILPVSSIELINKVYDCFKDDPSVSALLNMGKGQAISLTAVDCRKYTIFELDLIFEKGRVKILESGNFIEEYKPVLSKVHQGYQYLKETQRIETSLDRSIYLAVDNIYNHLVKNDPLKCSAKDALLTLKTAIKIRDLAS